MFLSYRRSDDRFLAGRLRDVLATEFGDQSIFLDVDSIEPGEDFRVAIRDRIAAVDVMLVLIGRHWDPNRLAVGNDPVRAELAEALRQAKRIIPVLISDAKMPTQEQLPDDVASLAYLNALVVRPDPDFRADAARLCEAIRPSAPVKLRRRAVPASVLVILGAAVAFGGSLIPGVRKEVPVPDSNLIEGSGVGPDLLAMLLAVLLIGFGTALLLARRRRISVVAKLAVAFASLLVVYGSTALMESLFEKDDVESRGGKLDIGLGLPVVIVGGLVALGGAIAAAAVRRRRR